MLDIEFSSVIVSVQGLTKALIKPHDAAQFLRKQYLSLVTRNSGFATTVDSNRPAQPQTLDTSLKFRI